MSLKNPKALALLKEHDCVGAVTVHTDRFTYDHERNSLVTEASTLDGGMEYPGQWRIKLGQFRYIFVFSVETKRTECFILHGEIRSQDFYFKEGIPHENLLFSRDRLGNQAEVTF